MVRVVKGLLTGKTAKSVLQVLGFLGGVGFFLRRPMKITLSVVYMIKCL